MTIVKLKIRESKEGFQVDLTAKQLDIETEGFLPPLPSQLETSFNNWQLAYRQIEAVRSCIAPAPGMRITPKSVTKYSSAKHTTSVKECLNQWLNCGDSRWLPVRDRLIAIAQQLHQNNEEIRVIVDAKDVSLRRLPWQEWNLFEEHYPQVEIALSAAKNTYKKASYPLPKSSKIRVLVAVGRSDGINTKDDLEVIKELEQHGAEVVCLMQPSREELCNALWNDRGYHIFIFTGHSGSREDGQIGWIELNDTDNLSIEEFKEALKQAINKGLQLAIFNSCDGLGLANQLAQLHLPRCIVMREPVPDKVAIEFLKHFFKEFTGNQSLSKALNKARKRLEHFNLDYPGAIWLPTICIAPNVKYLTWKSLNPNPVDYQKIDEKQDESKSNKNKYIKPILLTVLLIGSIYAFLAWDLSAKLKRIQDKLVIISGGKATVTEPDLASIPSGTFRYGGSTTWVPIRDKVERVLDVIYPEFQLEYTNPTKENLGSGTGIKMLLNRELDFALSSRKITLKEREAAKNQGVILGEIPVAIDAIAVAVHPSLKVNELTITELENIYTGKINNWKDLGGEDLQIVPISRHQKSGGTVEYFYQYILRGKEFDKKNLQLVPNTTQGIRKVAKNKGGIYYASASEVVNQCTVKTLKLGNTYNHMVAPYKQPWIPYPDCKQKPNEVNVDKLSSHDEYPITRRLYVIYKKDAINTGEPDLQPDFEYIKKAAQAARAYANWLKSTEGKQLIEQSGFAPID
ncbi:phosphate ABC transporter periplasmic phosphate-binding protein [Calothrix parasitica NIES-267]|uniref:Phosphate ABC transporter periplasmic phosphate-binding protein n=1 Tax=Calothrix parasitica NIES-267 TaxID=1973488 RepID=A0A1Z4LMC7_9CYAN|nr:phosphate ABC transporter periplasmic phosphate-binding protein [Calothrix parasitica NIES-267]